MRLKGKVALITGGGTGIGTAVAERFVAEGAKICITGRRRELLDKVAQTLTPGSVKTCPGDVTKVEDVERMVATALAFEGRLDVVVNNAGIDPGGTVTDLDPDLWRKVIEINLTGPFLVMKASIPHMIKGGGGSIINVSSLGGLRCLPGMAAYCTSKAGLIMLTKQAAPDEVSGGCVFLASDDSSFMTGSVLLLDGGASVVDVSGAALSSAGVNWGVTEAPK